MLTCDALLEKAGGRLRILKNFRAQADRDFTERLTLVIPDMHLLERGPTDDFLDRRPEYEDRFLDLLDFLLQLRQEEGDGLEIIQIGDLFDLWQAKGNTNLIVAAYPSVLGILQKLKPIYIVGNHDIDLVRWYRKQGQAFGRKWRSLGMAEGKIRTIFEHGFQADFANNQDSWSGVIGREVTKIVGMMEYLDPDIDVILGSAWDGVMRVFSKYNAFSPVQDPQGFNLDQYLRYYIELLDKYNQGKTFDAFGPGELDLSLAVIGHTHKARLVQMPHNGRTYYLLDCGSWVNGGHEVGILVGNEAAVGQWELKGAAPKGVRRGKAKPPRRKKRKENRSPRRQGR
jgi:UDP-2,3-diacylglucosamine pyrophosphatase LpxH